MRFSRKIRDRQLALDMTPMIDIVFQLLIFFLVTAQMVHLSRADVQLPKERGEQSRQAEQAGLIINVLKNGQIIISDRETALEDLDALVDDMINQTPGPPRSAGSAVKVTLRADRETDAARLNAIIDRLHKKGVGAAKIATMPR